MVQVIQLGPSRSALQGQILGQALGHGLGEFTGQFFASKALTELENDPELAQKPLSEQWQAYQSKLGKYGERGERLIQQRFQVAQQRQLEHEQDVLGRYASGEKLDPEDLKGLSVPTQLRLFQVESQRQQHQNKITNEQLASKAFSKGYSAILNNDTKSLQSVIDDPETPMNVKTQLSNIKNQHDLRADVRNRELRSRQSMVQTAYQKQINADKNLLKSARSTEKPEIIKRIERLEKMRHTDMQMILKDPESYGTLGIWGSPAAEHLPAEERGFGETDNMEEQTGSEMVNQEQNIDQLLDSLSDEQVAELYKASGGDIEKAKKLALERYGQ